MYICKNGNKIFAELPMKGTFIDHKSMVGMRFDVEYQGVVYKSLKILEYINTKNGGRFLIKYNEFIKADGVPSRGFLDGRFGEVLGVINHEYAYKIGEEVNGLKVIKYGRIYRENKVRKYSTKAYQVACTKCGFDGGKHYKNGELVEEYWVTEGSLTRGQGCPCCSTSPKIVIPEINSIWKTDHWMVELGVDSDESKKYTYQSEKNIKCICRCCGEIQYKNISYIYARKSIACTCGDGFSYPEKFMYSILKHLGVDFETQYSPEYLIPKNGNKKQRKYSDFYIPCLKLVIETDGRLGHIGGVVHTRSNKTLNECIDTDKWKDEQHLKHGIKTIRINCLKSDMEYIKENILNSELVNYFDLSNVDWDKVNEYAWYSNLKKEVCEYWNNKEEWETVKDLAKVFNVSTNLRNYLKMGTKLGWCHYDAKKEYTKGINKSGKNGRQVKIFKDGIELGLFESCMELERQSEELFGIKLYNSKISMVARGLRPHYKGYTFKFIDQEKSQVF